MFATLFLAAMFAAAPPPTSMVFSRADVRQSIEIGSSTWLVLDTQDTLLVPTALLTLTGEGDLMLVTDTSLLTSTYVDAKGISHTVTTDCRRFTDAQGCANEHAAMLTKLQALFPLPPRGP